MELRGAPTGQKCIIAQLRKTSIAQLRKRAKEFKFCSFFKSVT